MFFSRLLSSLLGWFIFPNLEESPYFKELKRQQGNTQAKVSKAPVKDVFCRQYRGLLVNLLITFGGGAGYCLTSGYLPRFPTVITRSRTRPRR